MTERLFAVNDHEFHVLQRTIAEAMLVRSGSGPATKAQYQQLALHRSTAQTGDGTPDLQGKTMKAFIVALVFAGLSAAGVSMLLNKFQEPGYVAFSTSGARVGDPGHNLIGPS